MSFEPATLPNGKSWLMRPVLRGIVSGERMLDHSLDLEDIADWNDALDVEAENTARAQATAQAARR